MLRSILTLVLVLAVAALLGQIVWPNALSTAHLHYGIYALGADGAAPSGAINPYPLLRAGANSATRGS